jgi:predicted  nucleic acid-binding Zn-ribbon protein
LRRVLLDAQVGRLERQLKSVIAPREAEALQHEIAERRAERSACDERELELMESLDACRVTLDDLAREIEVATEARGVAARLLKSAKGLVETEIAELTERRSAQCLVVPSSLLAIYEHKRASRPNGAVATLHGPTCGSCHMDLARTELDALRALPPGEYPECPQCGCFIVLIP